jgi:hypothetical protein
MLQTIWESIDFVRILLGYVIHLAFFTVVLTWPMLYSCMGVPPTFNAVIARNADSVEEEFMLQVAEAYYPAREDVLSCVDENGGDPLKVPEEFAWWCEESGDMLLPYAVTAEAVDYYQMLLEERREVAREGPYTNHYNTKFKYEADVEFFEVYDPSWTSVSYTDAYVVSMRIFWSVYCGSVCGWGFNHDRIVVLNVDGEVQVVFGDGDRVYPWVSKSGND